MGSTITRRSSEQATPQSAAEGQPLLDPSGQPAPDAPALLSWTPERAAVSHGREPPGWPLAADGRSLEPRGLVDRGSAALLEVTGPEREAWMQGVQTADVRAIPVAGAVRTLFLNARGRAVSEGLLWRLSDKLLVEAPRARLETLQQHLDALLIMEDAALAQTAGMRALRLCPSGAAELLAGLSPAQRETFAPIRGAATPLGLELLLPDALAAELLAAIPLRPDPGALELQRVALGVPAWAIDFDESSTPLEAGLDAQIAFGKGCYVGQEVIAMATYRGRVPWNLVRLEVEGAPPAVGAALDTARGGKGKVTSAAPLGARALLLGLVHREKIEPGSTVLLADGRAATVLGLPFGSRPGAGVKG